MKSKKFLVGFFVLITIIFFILFSKVSIFQAMIVFKNIVQFFAWSESSRDYWIDLTGSREFVFLAFFGKDVFSIFANLGIFRVVTLPVLKSRKLIFWFLNIAPIKKLLLYKQRLVIKANSGILFWQLVFFIILLVMSLIPIPYLQTIAVGLYVLAFFTEKNFAKLLGHYAFYALLLGSFLKYILVIYTTVFDNLFFVQF